MVATVPAGSPQNSRQMPNGRLPRELRWGWMDDEGRALASSYAAAVALALAWVLAVQLAPRPLPPTASDVPIRIRWADPVPPQPSVYPPVAAPGGRRGEAMRPISDAGAAAADAFRRGAGTVVDALGALRGVAVTRGGAPAALSGKIVLEHGDQGVGSRRPGLDPIGTPAGRRGDRIGHVGGAGAVTRAGAEIALPPVVVAPPRGVGSRSAAELGVLVRSRSAQLQSCYEREGRSRNPALAGTVVVSLTIAGSGEVTAADITRRSWYGDGAAEAEACIRTVVRTWRFPPADEGRATYSIPVSLTAGR